MYQSVHGCGKCGAVVLRYNITRIPFVLHYTRSPAPMSVLGGIRVTATSHSLFCTLYIY